MGQTDSRPPRAAAQLDGKKRGAPGRAASSASRGRRVASSPLHYLDPTKLTPEYLLAQEGRYRESDASLVYARNALCDAAAFGDEKAVAALLRSGADVNCFSERGETALHIATKRGHIKMMNVLLQGGATSNVRDPNGFTPLHYAVQCDLPQARLLAERLVANSSSSVAASNEAMINLLLANGGDVNAVSSDGVTCLHLAIHLKKVPETIALLGLESIKLHTRSVVNDTPLHALCALGITNLIDAALKATFFYEVKDQLEAKGRLGGKSSDAGFIADVLAPPLAPRVLRKGTGVLTARQARRSIRKNGTVKVLPARDDNSTVALRSIPCRCLSEAKLMEDFCFVQGRAGLNVPFVLLPVIPQRRCAPQLSTMTRSEKFKLSGADDGCSTELWSPCTIIQEEKSQLSPLIQKLRSRAGYSLARSMQRLRERKQQQDGTNALSSSMKRAMTQEAVFEMFRHGQHRSQAEPDTSSDDDGFPPPISRRSPTAPFNTNFPKPQESATISPRGSPVATPAGGSSPVAFHRELPLTRRGRQNNIESRMALLFGNDVAEQRAAGASGSSDSRSSFQAAVALMHSTQEVDVDQRAFDALFPTTTTVTAPEQGCDEVCLLDRCVTEGTDEGCTPLGVCTNANNPLFTALQQKRDVLLLLCLRADLLAKTSFGFELTL